MNEKFLQTIEINGVNYHFYSLKYLGDEKIWRLPYSIRILLEAALWKFDGFVIKDNTVESILNWGN